MIYSTKKQQKEYSVFSKFLIIFWYIVVIALLMYLCNPSWAQEVDHESVAHREVVRYVSDWTKNLPPRYRNRAMQHVKSVAYWSMHYGLDPLLVAVKVSLESSWNSSAIGKSDKELGLMQIHPLNKRARKGFDFSDPDQQIQAGTKELRYCINMCNGDVKKGINAYATGSCTKDWRGLNYTWRLYKQAVKRFRE